MFQLTIEKISATLTKLQWYTDEHKDALHTIYLLGTAHISEKSALEIENLVAEYDFDTVAIELDKQRYESITDKDRWASLDIFKVIKEGHAPLLMVQLAMAGMQKRMGEKLETQSGVDMLKAIEVAQREKYKVALIDRSVKTTFLRAWRRSSFWQKNQILAVIFASAFDRSTIDEEQLEKLKEEGSLDQLLEELGKELPSIKEVLIHERDQYLANSLYQADSTSILAVVGAGHVPGILEHMKKLEAKTVKSDNKPLDVVPPKSKWTKVFYALIPIVVIGAIFVAYLVKGSVIGNQTTLTWVLYNSIAAGVLTLAALPAPLTVLVAAVASPITSLIPVIGVSLFTGLTQAWLRKPSISDVQNLTNDVCTFKGWYKNRITRIFLVMIASTIGSSLGGLSALARIIPILS